jgi:hypothetical protein
MRHALLTTGILACAAPHRAAPPPVLPATIPSAIVTGEALLVAFPPEPRGDTAWTHFTVRNRFAGYFWHILIRTHDGWLAAGFQIDPNDKLEIPSFPSLTAVIAAGRLASCQVETHIIACADPIEGTVRAEGSRVVISITDVHWLGVLTHERPPRAHLARGQQNAYAWRDSLPLLFY